jgi:hypothetical protein
MKLTWRDTVSTLTLGVIVAVYAAYLADAGLWLIGGTRGTTAAVLVLGAVGGCAIGAAGDAYTGVQTTMTRVFMAAATTFGVVALGAAVIGLITASHLALAVLFGATVALWATATIRHALATPGGPRDRDVHEVIPPRRTAQR